MTTSVAHIWPQRWVGGHSLNAIHGAHKCHLAVRSCEMNTRSSVVERHSVVSGRSVKASLGRSVVGHSGGLGTEVEKWCPPCVVPRWCVPSSHLCIWSYCFTCVRRGGMGGGGAEIFCSAASSLIALCASWMFLLGGSSVLPAMQAAGIPVMMKQARCVGSLALSCLCRVFVRVICLL